jgi:MFS superfamily sulfate permease-like transporter
MPHAALAAVVVATTVVLFKPAEFAAIRSVRAKELWWALAPPAGVLLLGTLNGILIAVAISVLALFHQANRPPVYVIGRRRGTALFEPIAAGDDAIETLPGLLILRTEGRVHFANARRIGDAMWVLIEDTKPRVVALDLRAVPDFEYTALTALIEAEQKLSASGVTLWLVAVTPRVQATIQRSPLGSSLAGRVFPNLERVTDAYLAQGLTEPGEAAHSRP